MSFKRALCNGVWETESSSQYGKDAIQVYWYMMNYYIIILIHL